MPTLGTVFEMNATYPDCWMENKRYQESLKNEENE